MSQVTGRPSVFRRLPWFAVLTVMLLTLFTVHSACSFTRAADFRVGARTTAAAADVSYRMPLASAPIQPAAARQAQLAPSGLTAHPAHLGHLGHLGHPAHSAAPSNTPFAQATETDDCCHGGAVSGVALLGQDNGEKLAVAPSIVVWSAVGPPKAMVNSRATRHALQRRPKAGLLTLHCVWRT